MKIKFILLFCFGNILINNSDLYSQNPTNLIFSNVKSYNFDASFTGSSADGYLVLSLADVNAVDIPEDGTVYSAGDPIGNSKVVQSSSSTSFSPRNIIASTEFHYSIFAYNGNGTSRVYDVGSPLTGSVLTPDSMYLPNYYATVNIASANFMTALHNVISPHTQHSYNTYKTKMVRDFYERDTLNNQKVLTCLYTGINYIYTPPFEFNTIGFSREHTFPHSWFPDNSTGANYYSDYHNLFPLHQNSANSIRSNYPFGDVVSDTLVIYGEGILGRNAKGKIVYEPRDEQKGDAARALMYMSIRYNGENGLNWSIPSYISYTITYGQDEALLKKWHFEDPPSPVERARNDYIQTLQGNRNPFVDHPEYACYIDFNTMTYIPEGCFLNVKEELLDKSVTVSPNPSSEVLSIKSDKATIESYKIIDFTGRVIQANDDFSQSITSIDVSLIQSGTYVIEITTSLGIISKKIIVN